MKTSQYEIVVPIPQSLIDQLADEVAEKVMARISVRLEVLGSQSSRPARAEVDQVEVTFLRLGDITKRTGLE